MSISTVSGVTSQIDLAAAAAVTVERVDPREPSVTADYLDLVCEYLTWHRDDVRAKLGISFEVDTALAGDRAKITRLAPPHGALVLARYRMRPVGCAGIQRLNEEVGELKRLYVRPEMRGMGVAQRLLEGALRAAASLGYTTLRLDSFEGMHEAMALYRRLGFHEIERYEGSMVTPEQAPHFRFFERATRT